MQYRKILFLLMVVMTAMVFGGISPAFASCPEGKSPVTIVNPAGKAIEICVPSDVAEKIGMGNNIIIPSTCPCFSQASIEAIVAAGNPLTCVTFSGTTISTNSPCSIARCTSSTGSIDLYAWESPLVFDRNDLCDIQYPPGQPWAMIWTNSNGCDAAIDQTWTWFPNLSEAQGDVCVGILKTFVTSP